MQAGRLRSSHLSTSSLDLYIYHQCKVGVGIVLNFDRIVSRRGKPNEKVIDAVLRLRIFKKTQRRFVRVDGNGQRLARTCSQDKPFTFLCGDRNAERLPRSSFRECDTFGRKDVSARFFSRLDDTTSGNLVSRSYDYLRTA